MLTPQEHNVLSLAAAGLSADEIADSVGIEPNTARKHIDNIKKKVGWNKASELAGYGICEFLGLDYSEVRKKMLSAIMLMAFIVGLTDTDNLAYRRTLRYGRKQEIEYII